ncbi:hypothetical protein FACS189473_5120 [Spirochaetia bacterium]|nr:hypothetical protein FACS189473_5120 [Spirochaetia bacterium]
MKTLRFYFTAAILCLVTLVSGCDVEIPEAPEWHFSVNLTVKNETDSTVNVSLESLSIYGDRDDNGLLWGYEWINDKTGLHHLADSTAVASAGSQDLSIDSYCYTHSTKSGIGIASFLVNVNGERLYAGWDVSQYGNKVNFENNSVITEVDFAGQVYGYVFVENSEAAGLWHSTLSPHTKALKNHRFKAAYTVTITDAGASFDSVELEE